MAKEPLTSEEIIAGIFNDLATQCSHSFTSKHTTHRRDCHLCLAEIEAEAKAQKYNISCPFCGDDEDYDLPGLKYHLARYCEAYQNTEVLGL